jgi:hypothetical protein
MPNQKRRVSLHFYLQVKRKISHVLSSVGQTDDDNEKNGCLRSVE